MMGEKNLPEGWTRIEFKDAASYVIGGDWGKNPGDISDEDFQLALCIRGGEIKNWQKDKGNTASLRAVKTSSLQSRQLILGDILLEISGGGPEQPVGRTVIIDHDVLDFEPDIPKICTNFLRLIRISDELNKVYINHYLQYFYTSGEIVKYQGGSNNLRNLKYKEYETIQIPLPPLAEQNRIVAKLDTLFAHLETIKTRLEAIPQLLKNFRQAVLSQAVSGKLTETWREGKELGDSGYVKLNDLGSWKGGGTPSKSNKSFWLNGDVLWITSKDMKGLFLSDSMDKITRSGVQNSSATLIPANSILIVTRSGILRRILPVSTNTIEATVNQDLKVLIPNNKSNFKYILYALRGVEEDIRNVCMKSGTTVESVDFDRLKKYEIRLPSLPEQQEIVSRVESLFAKADAIEAQYQSLKAKIDTLPQALLAKAFSGQLVPQNPADEPASELLKRIKETQGLAKKVSKLSREIVA